ncbi:MAG TPA: NUDIX domain-containing protein [Nocardioidaceae bacterium]|nr:NUDIX domain-containing protein [Nocardioidaceae bacterium]
MPASPFALVPAAYVLLLRDGPNGAQVLLQRRSNTGFMDDHWAASAAGHVEPGESCTAAALRETREELGVEVTEADLEALCAVHRYQQTDRPVDQRVDFFFRCRRWTGEPALREPKASALDWYDVAALPDPVVPHELAVLRGLAGGSLPPVSSFGFSGLDSGVTGVARTDPG